MGTDARRSDSAAHPRVRTRDVVLGMSDGLTVPFALAAGVSGAVHSRLLVLIAGCAELAAGAVSMGLGGYLAAQSDVDLYVRARRKEEREVVEVPDEERMEVRQILADYGLSDDTLERAVGALTANADTWVRFMMRNELGLEAPHPTEHVRSGATIGVSYVAGGVVPLLPYLAPVPLPVALALSAVLTLAALLVFGWVKGSLVGTPPALSAVQAALVGGVAAAVAFALARLIAAWG